MNADSQPIDQQLRSYSAVTIVEEDDIDWALEGFSVRDNGGTVGDYDYHGRGNLGGVGGCGGYYTSSSLGFGGNNSCSQNMMIWNPAKISRTLSPTSSPGFSPASSSNTPAGTAVSQLLLDGPTIESAGVFAPTLSSSASAINDVHRQRRHQSRRSPPAQRCLVEGGGPELSPTSLEHAKKVVLTGAHFPSSNFSGPNRIRCDEL
mmetsp:Transcript_27156/g.64974  ORF Transcript_27156/g.64974 Transcript_27156/m.64974 type:complete len:205 (+) Transcript_27156:268-882(+)|eukprot:CAMPEP_0113464074 /NCGR_PEP_ID=MMETSP0014_2-20120614/13003_1 /TAXON_ID=2857 /ORGANISM="Nitzschia sp." /LENGTH=204 /DNA_ID=CAMNT_0000356123 /DNA_START=142 /DNA_END=756 /DNA_ORIENTATION=- /assembly_acc=CAM_ASM_000159